MRWKDALDIEASLDMQQAIVYSGTDDERETELTGALSKWTENHPLILPVLDAKGLEYDDIIVAFDKVRSAWDGSKKVRSWHSIVVFSGVGLFTNVHAVPKRSARPWSHYEICESSTWPVCTLPPRSVQNCRMCAGADPCLPPPFSVSDPSKEASCHSY